MVVDGNEKAANGQWYHQGELSEDEVERYRHPLKHPYLDGLEKKYLVFKMIYNSLGSNQWNINLNSRYLGH